MVKPDFQTSLQIALVHIFFNVIGTLIWAVFPIMRRLPIAIAEFGGERAEKYRWWGIAYLVAMYLIVPLVVFLISLASPLAASSTIYKLLYSASPFKFHDRRLE